MNRATLRQRLRYRFDNFMSKGGRSIFLSLSLVFMLLLGALVLVRVVLHFLFPGAPSEAGNDVLADVFITFLQLTDPGTMSMALEASFLFKVLAVFGGLVGIILTSMLIAFITTALDQKLADLRRGHSQVIEEGHTLILGWSDQRVLEILRELVLANESEEDPALVILSEMDKEAMDDYLKLHQPDTLNTRVVTRSGATSSIVNLGIVAVERCKSVIILASCGEGASEAERMASDAKVIKSILAVIATQEDEHELCVVAEVFSERNRRVAEDVAPGHVHTVDTQDILAKLLVQTSRSVGLSVVYSEILSFDGGELYFYGAEWGKRSFGQVGFHFEDGVPLGILRRGSELLLNPPVDTPLEVGDELLVLAEDDSTIEFLEAAVAEPQDLEPAGMRREQTRERQLILGWSSKARIIVEQFADYVAPGSEVDIVLADPDPILRREIEELDERLPDLVLRLHERDPLQTGDLLSLEPFGYENIIILNQSGFDTDAERTDAETIIILLLLRSIFRDHPEEAASTNLITEVLASENQELVARAGVNDFIISNRFVSMLLAQISENPNARLVYDDLFQEDGSEIYLKSAELYLSELPVEVSFADLMGVAQKRGEVCLGIRSKSRERDEELNFGVELNPAKDKRFTLAPGDSLVVLAEDET